MTVEDAYGGTLSCTYDISPTLSGLRKEFQKMAVSDSEIAAFADSEKIQLDEAMQRVAFRYVEAEIFATLGAGRFLHTELKSALKQTLSELLDLAFLRATREYGCEVVEPGSGRAILLSLVSLTALDLDAQRAHHVHVVHR